MTQHNERDVDANDVRGTAGALVFIAVGVVVLWDAGHINNWAGAVFPRALAILMIGLSITLVVRNLLGFSGGAERPPSGSVPRRVGLVVAMLLAAVLMPYLGFMITGVAAYVAIMVVAMYERWTKLRVALYPAVGVVTVFAFHLLFDTIFHVPLPDGRLFW